MVKGGGLGYNCIVNCGRHSKPMKITKRDMVFCYMRQLHTYFCGRDSKTMKNNWKQTQRDSYETLGLNAENPEGKFEKRHEKAILHGEMLS